MTGYDFFRVYQPLHLHFTSSYDLFKYSGKSKTINPTNYNKRHDVHLLETWGHRFQSKTKLGAYCLANFVYNDRAWLYQAREQSEEIYIKWKGYISSKINRFTEDVKTLREFKEQKSINDKQLFQITPNGNKPPLLQLYLAGYISKESIIVIDNHIRPFLEPLGDTYESDPLVSDQIFLIRKYTPFIINDIDRKRVRQVFKEVMTDE